MWKGGYVVQFMVCPSSCLKGLRKTTNLFKFVCVPAKIRIIKGTNTRQKPYRFLNCVDHFFCSPEIVSSSVYSLHVFFLLALQPPLGVVFYSPLAGFSLLAYEVS